MAQHIMHSRWGVQIEGCLPDLENLSNKLNCSLMASDDLFVSMFNNVFALRSARWDGASDLSQVKVIAEADISVVRGLIDLLDGCDAIEIGTIFEFDNEDNFVNRTRSTDIKVRVRKPPEEFATPKEFKRLLRSAERFERIGRAISELRSDPSWFDIYKSIEALEDANGGERGMLRAFAGDADKIKLVKRTANGYRHVGGKFIPPSNPVQLNDARALVIRLIIETQNRRAPVVRGDDFAPGTEIVIPNHSFETDTVIALNKLSLGPSRE